METIIELLKSPPIVNAFVSILCGSIIGFEREYRNKSAGFRTVILICFGSAMFTIVSRMFNGVSDDRIAANIVTGIGFIGAGVIFKGKLSVTGLTTSAVIWATAGIGMFAGLGKIANAFILTIFMIVILSVFQGMEIFLSRYYLIRSLHIRFNSNEFQLLHQFEGMAADLKLRTAKKSIEKIGDKLEVTYDISGKLKNLDRLNQVLVELTSIEEFYYNK